MPNELAEVAHTPPAPDTTTTNAIPVRELQNMQAQILQVMEDIMKPGTHYGNIPGCPRKVLLQPGAEKLLETFRLAAFHTIDDLSTPASVRYRVRCEIRSIITGVTIGDEWGECSSDEEKYAWRAATGQGEYDATPADLRRLKWYKDRDGKEATKRQVRQSPADSANTILAMACKRAKVRAARAALAASDLFEINVEDLPQELREEYFGEPATETTPSPALQRRQQPQRQQAPAQPAGARQGANVMDLLVTLGWTEPGDNGPKPTREAFTFISKLGVASKWKEWSQQDRAQVVTALQTEIASAQALQSETTATNEPEGDIPADITDPFADQ